MSPGEIVDWGLAERVASAFAGSDRASVADPEFDQSAVESACEWARPLVVAYTELAPPAALPSPETVDRSEWARLGLSTLRELSAELEAGLSGGLDLPGPLGPLAASLAGAAAGAEAGLAVGYAARKVLGQYDMALAGEPRPPRLLFVAPNLAAAHAQLGGAPRAFLRWIAAHETTHAVQFAAVPWLRDHLTGLLDELVRGAAAQLRRGALGPLAKRLLTSDPRRTLRAALRGELPRLLMDPAQAETLDRLQATMAVIEGHAEHVMDAALGERERGLAALRGRLEARRAARAGIGDVIARLLGLDLKLRQYQLGKAFCDAVVAERGVAGLNATWAVPAALPTLDELERPADWLARTAEPAAA